MDGVQLNEVAGIIKFDPSDLIKWDDISMKIPSVLSKINPIILINMVKIGASFKISNDDIKKNLLYSNYHMKNTSENFIDSFKINKGEYEDVDIWECQFEEGNQIFLLNNEKMSDYYVLHISFLPNFHNDLIKIFKNRTQKNQTILQYYNEIHKITKDILLRNSQRKLFLFCSENSLNCKWIFDSKAVPIKSMANPPMCELFHYEFLNDFCLFEPEIKNEEEINMEITGIKNLPPKLLYFKNCSIHTIKSSGHVKIYSDKKFHFLKDINMGYLESLIGYENKHIDIYSYLNISSLIEKNKPDNFYNKLIYTNPHIVYNLKNFYTCSNYEIMNNKSLYLNTPNLDKMYKAKIILKTVQIFK